ncbi:signal peptidase I [Streptomyces beijiangensis]|uniref:Signal peptidase I n=1 Tax=Streptomyces beijiangensis TaxID=163361 RepID=A0A939F1W4_9ACTN|nr:signal peptidase I [Streptomyces beijiangensis]MBO0510981.1 signal peptidase I [Streptomyces beijiangensis]
MAVGARSGHDGPEDRPGTAGDAEVVDSEADSEVGSEAVDGDEAEADEPAPKKQRSFWKELPLLIGIALVLALLIKTFLVQAFSIPSDSMQDTLQRGDRVLVDKLTPWFGSEPSRGEVVVFHDPGGWLDGEPTVTPNVVQKFLSLVGLMPSAEEKDLIKRVIAVGGDTVSCKKGGPVVVNGKALEEKSYIYPGDTPCDDEPFGPIHVPKGSIWVMGDHRQNSLDSRYHQELKGGGTVENKFVVGRAFTVAWPINHWDWLSVPSTFDQSGINAAAAVGPGALGLAGALPIVLRRRRRLTSGPTAG